MRLEDINKNLNKMIVYQGAEGVYKLTACIKRKDKTGKVFYRVEILDTKNKNSVLIVGLDDIAESEEIKMNLIEVSNRLKRCFPKSISFKGDFCPSAGTEIRFNLEGCKTDLEVKCKVLEAFSGATFKAEPFDNGYKNFEFQDYMISGINLFLDLTTAEKELTAEGFELIYKTIGDGVNRELCEKFIESGCDLTVLKEGENNAE